MEHIHEFEKALSNLLIDAKKNMNMTDDTLAWILLREGTAHYFRTLEKCGRCPLKYGVPGNENTGIKT